MGKKTPTDLLPHGERIWGLSWVGIVGKEDQTEKSSLLSVPLLKHFGNPSKMGIRFGFNEVALLFGTGLLWNVLFAPPQEGKGCWWLLRFHSELYS